MKFEKWFFAVYDKKLERSINLNGYINLPLINIIRFNFFFQNETNLLFKNLSFYSEIENLEITKINQECFFTDIYSFNQQNSNSFLHLRKSSFISFFIDNMIDVPICFKKSKSLKYKNFELPFLKFINLLMRQGKKEQITTYCLQTLFTFFNFLKFNKTTSMHTATNWMEIYFIINNLFKHFQPEDSIIFHNDNDIFLSFNSLFLNYEKTAQVSFFIKNFFIKQISQIIPIFSYFIYSVDKNIRKYSRGKSGKYTFIWKYIAPYKRSYMAFRWILKDIKFNNNKRLKTRITETFFMLMFEIQKSFAWKSKTYSYNYIFKNFKKTLMTTLKTMLK